MTQPQNPNITPLMAQIEGNPLGADLIQIVEVGGQVIYRINNFQAVWYVGSGNPTFIPGQLTNNLYLDNITGHIWQFNGFIWNLLPSGGGGSGSGAIGVAFTTSANPFDTIPVPGVLSSSYAVISATNGVAAAMIAAGQVEIVVGTDIVTVTHPPTAGGAFNIVTSASSGGTGLGVTELNGLTGDLNVTAGSGISVVATGLSIVVTNQGVTSVNSLAGALSLVAGANVTITPSGNSLIIAASGGGGGGGVTSLNSLTGALAVTAGPGVTVTPSGSSIEVTNSIENAVLPWQDIQNFGGIPKTYATYYATTTVNINSGSPNASVGSALPFFVNGAGVCIWGAGPAVSMSTPLAPTATSPVVQGSQTIRYQCVAFDAHGGLTAASLTGSVTNAPAVFGHPPVTISSITASAGTITVNLASPLNTTVTAGMTVHIVGVTGGGSGWNGVFTIATAPTNSQITYSLVGASGSGTVTGATARVSNVQLISSISRAATGIISVTTLQTHNFQIGAILIIENVTPADLCGFYEIISTPTANTLTCISQNTFAETGVVSTAAPQSTATVWEYITVACPALTTINTPPYGYYIYSDSPNPGGALVLVGRTLFCESHFTDYGQAYGSGYVAPAYVPTLPPSSAFPQMLSTTILSGGGTTNLVLAANASSNVSSGTIMYDDGPALLAALAAGPTLLSPSLSETVALPYAYNFASPLVLPANSQVTFATTTIINEPWFCTNENVVLSGVAAASSLGQSFGLRPYTPIYGKANPFFLGGNGFNLINGLALSCSYGNGQNLVEVIGTYSEVSDCAFEVGEFGTSIPLVYNGGIATAHLRDNTYSGSSVFGDGPVPGQSSYGPFVPMISFRASDNSFFDGFPPNQIVMDGMHTFNSRCIMFDGTYFTNGTAFQYKIGDSLWVQGPTMPSIIFYGATYSGIEISGVLMDSEPIAILGNYATLYNVKIDNCTQGDGATIYNGNVPTGLYSDNYYGFTPDAPNTVSDLFGNMVQNQATGRLNASSTLQSKPLILGQSGSVFERVVAPTPTLSISGVGTIPAGIYQIGLTLIGWDGGETTVSLLASITVNGSQGIQVAWTMPSGFQYAHIYTTTANGGPSSLTLQTGNFTTSPQTFSSFISGNGYPNLDGTGLPFVGASEVITPTIVVPSGVNKLSISAPTLTANRTQSLPDSTGIIALSWTNVNVSPVTVNAATLADQLLMSATVPANTLNSLNRTLKVRLSGVYSLPVSTSPTSLTFKIKLGSLTLIDIVTTASSDSTGVTNNKWILDCDITTQTAGASAAFEASARLTIDLGALDTSANTTFMDINTSTIGTLDTTANQTLQNTVSFSTSTTSNTCTQRQMVLNTIN
jgi:hypothetical protein